MRLFKLIYTLGDWQYMKLQITYIHIYLRKHLWLKGGSKITVFNFSIKYSLKVGVHKLCE
jgi:hypothetical protein